MPFQNWSIIRQRKSFHVLC